MPTTATRTLADLEILQRNPILGELGPEDLRELVALSHTKHFARNRVLFSKGEPGDCVYLIVSGRIAIETVSEDGKVALLNLLEPGDMVGEIAAIDGKERTAGARALWASTLLRIERKDFIAFLERHPTVCLRMMVLLCDRLRWTSAVIEDLTFLDVHQRLAKRLIGLSRIYGVPVAGGIKITESLSQESLAQMIGVSREFVNKCLRYFQESGAIRYDHGHIVIVDQPQLEQLGG